MKHCGLEASYWIHEWACCEPTQISSPVIKIGEMVIWPRKNIYEHMRTCHSLTITLLRQLFIWDQRFKTQNISWKLDFTIKIDQIQSAIRGETGSKLPNQSSNNLLRMYLQVIINWYHTSSSQIGMQSNTSLKNYPGKRPQTVFKGLFMKLMKISDHI